MEQMRKARKKTRDNEGEEARAHRLEQMRKATKKSRENEGEGARCHCCPDSKDSPPEDRLPRVRFQRRQSSHWITFGYDDKFANQRLVSK